MTFKWARNNPGNVSLQLSIFFYDLSVRHFNGLFQRQRIDTHGYKRETFGTIQNSLLKVSNVACGCVRVRKKRDHARPRTKPVGAKTRPRGTLLYSSLPYSALLYSTPLKCPEHRSFSRKLPSNSKEFACKQDSIIQDTSLFAE